MSCEEFFYNFDFSYLKPIGFGYSQCQPGYNIGGPRIRDHWVLHFIVSGKGIFVKDGKTYTVGAGNLFVIAPFEETYYEADKDDPWYYIWIDFFYDGDLSDVLNSPVIYMPGARKYFEDIKCAEGMAGGKQAHLAGCLWNFISSLFEKKKEKFDHIRSAVSYINSNYMLDITVSSVAEYLNLDRTYFSTLFKKRMGISPKQYINDVRLNYAVLFMTEHGVSPSKVAENVGFCDVYYFTKVFKARFGCPPREYIKKNLKK